MVYNNKFVVVIKSGHKVLREKGDTVFIPFGSEYSILMKNLNTVKAIVTVLVDGKTVSPGSQFIIDAGESLELEGFLKNSRVTNRFKFIERTKRIEKHRGIHLCDGLVQVTFQFEKKPCHTIKWDSYQTKPVWYDNSIYHYYDPAAVPLRTKSRDVTYSTNAQVKASCDLNDTGITVKGSESDQSFCCGSVGSLENQKYNIVLQLKGKLKKRKLKKAVLTKTKLCCDICGKKNKSSNKFCVECGTALF